MIGVVVPAHNEEQLIGDCLRSLAHSALDPALDGEEVRVFVVLDRCSDRTASIAEALGATCLVLAHGNVGLARAHGFEAAIQDGARWVSTTDADSVVPADWLSAQLGHGCDAFCGVVTIRDWSEYDDVVRDEYMRTECRIDDHPHVHGANLGVSAEVYRRCGGFLPLPAHEDVTLVRAIEASGARIARRLQPTVVTSARKSARAREGFSDYLRALEARVLDAAQGTGAGDPALIPAAVVP